MARLRHALAATLALMLAVLLPRVTRAQSCHVEPPQELRGPGWWLALSQETARFESSRYDGHYQGVLVTGGVAGRRLSAGLQLAAYRIVRNGLPNRGLGDLSVHSRALLVGEDRARAQAGLTLAVTLPTGDVRADLGMGHVMLMPGVWAAARAQQLSLSSQITYGKSLSGNNAHHHHGSVGPLVAPMSASELDATLSASLPIYPSATRVRLRSGIVGVLPILDAHTAARAELIVGLLFGGRANTSLEGHLPITGEPSTFKLVLSVGIR